HHPNGRSTSEGVNPNPPGAARPESYEPSRDSSIDRSAFRRPSVTPNPYDSLTRGMPVENIGPSHPLSPNRNLPFGRTPVRGPRTAGAPIPLAPNTAYRVTDQRGRDRGLFITDENGNIREVITNSGTSRSRDLNSGSREGFNPDLRHPFAGAEYTVDQKFVYRTDSEGRVVQAEGRLEHTGSDRRRRGPDQTGIGRYGQQEYARINAETEAEFKRIFGRDPSPEEVVLFAAVAFNGGHLFGTEFDGPGEAINMVPMLESINQGQTGATPTDSWRRMEEVWVEILSRQPPPQVNVRIDLTFDPNDPESKTPKSIEVTYVVDGTTLPPLPFGNVPPRA
ncbi:DNA/RNA non-specific endonuclease, partial [Nocardia noduli]|uniref:DNA/RNA non-specific endonuclease n=1 Tax=Nocardia noduli TaxID=2815722 RepID=UPI001C2476B7